MKNITKNFKNIFTLSTQRVVKMALQNERKRKKQIEYSQEVMMMENNDTKDYYNNTSSTYSFHAEDMVQDHVSGIDEEGLKKGKKRNRKSCL